MNNTKSPKNVSLKNQLELWLFCALIGVVAGALVFMQVYLHFLVQGFPDFHPLIWWKSREKTICL